MINTLPKDLIEAVSKVINTHIDVDGVQKHRYNSDGNLIHPTDEGIKNFHRWFNGSKNVDKQGRPLVLYHGTNNPDFSEFKNVSKSINTTTFGDVPTTRHGIFFSTNKDFSKQYGNTTKPVYLLSKTPHKNTEYTRPEFADTLDAFEDRDNWINAKHGREAWGLHENSVGEKFVDYLKSKGNDSHIFREDIEDASGNYHDGITHVVFSPHQIKSAEHNTGEYHPDKASIHE